jgi:hypothetical protein
MARLLSHNSTGTRCKSLVLGFQSTGCGSRSVAPTSESKSLPYCLLSHWKRLERSEQLSLHLNSTHSHRKYRTTSTFLKRTSRTIASISSPNSSIDKFRWLVRVSSTLCLALHKIYMTGRFPQTSSRCHNKQAERNMWIEAKTSNLLPIESPSWLKSRRSTYKKRTWYNLFASPWRNSFCSPR